jgi:hypothetical protein
MDGACEQRAVTVLGAALGETGRETQIALPRITKNALEDKIPPRRRMRSGLPGW